MTRSSRRLIVYAKRPIPGYAKTRLGQALGAEASAGVYARLLYAYLLDLACADVPDLDIELAVASPDDVPFFALAFPEIRVRPQVDGDLGQRMASSFERAFQGGADRVVLTGSDIPGLGHQMVMDAFKLLDEADLVIGPAEDGGYYLIGMRAPGADVFRGIDWSTGRVLAQTQARARAQDLTVARAAERFDVDGIEDYHRWKASLTCF